MTNTKELNRQTLSQFVNGEDELDLGGDLRIKGGELRLKNDTLIARRVENGVIASNNFSRSYARVDLSLTMIDAGYTLLPLDGTQFSRWSKPDAN